MNFTEAQVRSFEDWENVMEWRSERVGELCMDAHYLGMDGISMDALPPVHSCPAGYEDWLAAGEPGRLENT